MDGSEMSSNMKAESGEEKEGGWEDSTVWREQGKLSR